MKQLIFGTKYRMMICMAVACILTVAASWTMAKSNGAELKAENGQAADSESNVTSQDASWSKAILTVSNMSCGGCIDTITKGVAKLAGTGKVDVDLASSSASILYDENIVTDPQTIAKVITDSGYPAKIEQLVSSEQLNRQIIEATKKAKTDIAKVGRLNIARKDFNLELAHARSRYQKIYGAEMFSSPQGKQLLQRLQAQITLRLVDEAIKYQEMDKAGYTINDDKIEKALVDYTKERKTSLDQLKRDLEANDYPFDHFKRKFGQRVKLQSYLEDEILSGSIDQDDRQQRYNNWLTNARALATVVYYDKNLESLVKARSGGGCGGGGSGSCSTRNK